MDRWQQATSKRSGSPASRAGHPYTVVRSECGCRLKTSEPKESAMLCLSLASEFQPCRFFQSHGGHNRKLCRPGSRALQNEQRSSVLAFHFRPCHRADPQCERRTRRIRVLRLGLMRPFPIRELAAMVAVSSLPRRLQTTTRVRDPVHWSRPSDGASTINHGQPPRLNISTSLVNGSPGQPQNATECESSPAVSKRRQTVANCAENIALAPVRYRSRSVHHSLCPAVYAGATATPGVDDSRAP
jgi:hypothetical protein